MTREEEIKKAVQEFIEERKTAIGRAKRGGWYFADIFEEGIKWADKHPKHYACIRPATDEDIERINKDREKRELIKHLNGVVWYNLPLKSLTHIWDVVKKEIGDIAAKQ